MKSLIVPLALVLLVFAPQRAVSAIPTPWQSASFEVASIKPSDPEDRSGKFIRMQNPQRFETRNYTLKEMIAAAYNLPNRAISGGPAWIDSERYNILATTIGNERPTSDQQMEMLRSLLESRFNLSVHREQKEQPLYELTIANNGSKLKETTAAPSEEYLINRMFNDNHVLLPARRVTMALTFGLYFSMRARMCRVNSAEETCLRRMARAASSAEANIRSVGLMAWRSAAGACRTEWLAALAPKRAARPETKDRRSGRISVGLIRISKRNRCVAHEFPYPKRMAALVSSDGSAPRR